MSRRRTHRTPDLTSLLDVLFILIFASLIRTAALQNAEANQEPPPRPVVATAPPPPPDVAALRERALANFDKQLASRTPLVIRISNQGVIVAVEADGKKLPLDVPLLEHSPDPDIGVAYLGERSAELRVCRVAALHLQAANLDGYLVIVSPAVALSDLPHALHQGLHRDLDRCLTDQRGLATIVDPAALVVP
ncbi:MAG: hypothetical protein H0T42_24440 [Deltaproteobacteria bacterium]|nr:hypothetical protein [Deltaproteobacteria bacterium]